MPSIDIVVESKVSRSPRARQLEAMFDVPASEMSKMEWHGEIPYDAEPWNIGLIVGPSGSGKTQIARHLFGDAYHPAIKWESCSVIDDFSAKFSMPEVSAACQAVGFNTIPAWLRPFRVLSMGEQFRVDLARRVLELPDPIIVDEFSSVVDRQVAQIGSHAVQKLVRKQGRKFIALSCHYDIVDWLQPDWIFEPATMHFARRLLRQRPPLEIEIKRVAYSAWKLFAPFHYLTADLAVQAQCFVLSVGDYPASFGAMLHRPASRGNELPVKGLSRLVTLPDWQGLGLALILSDTLAAAYAGLGIRMRTYPAHPALVRSYDHSRKWALIKKPGVFSARSGSGHVGFRNSMNVGGRPCAVFEWAGEKMDRAQAAALISGQADQSEKRETVPVPRRSSRADQPAKSAAS